MSDIKINFFKADNGDSFLLEFDNSTSLLIDGGLKKSMRRNIVNIKEIYKKTAVNAIILTHIDKDHINGIIELFEKHSYLIPKISMMIFNDSNSLKDFIPTCDSYRKIRIGSYNNSLTSYQQSITLEDLLENHSINRITKITALKKFVINNEISVIALSPSIYSMNKYHNWLEKKRHVYTSPSKDYKYSINELYNSLFHEDDRVENVSSISLLLEYKNKKLLFLGDSIPSDIASALIDLGYSEKNKLEVDVVKISHHGSRNNTSTEMLRLIKCSKFLISTNGTEHPNKECLSRIIITQNCPELIFNYDNVSAKIFTDEELNKQMFKISITNEVII